MFNKKKMSMVGFNKENAIVLPYGHCEYLLRGLQPIGYNSCIYGWNCDIYYDCGYYIITGYRNTRGYRVNYNCVDYFNSICEHIAMDYNTDYDTRIANIAQYRSEFCKLVSFGDDIQY